MRPSVGNYALSGELAAVQPCDAAGHIVGSLDTYTAWFAYATAIAAARTTHLDLFNASTSVLRLASLRPVIGLMAAVTGVGFHWEVLRSTSVGTGGTVVTPQKSDSAFANLPVGITARQRPTGGAASGATLYGFSLQGEETAHTAALMGNMLPTPLVLRQNEGVKLDQITNSAAGNFGWLLTFTVES